MRRTMWSVWWIPAIVIWVTSSPISQRLLLFLLASFFHLLPVRITLQSQINYLRQVGYVFARVCLSVCLCVSKITRKVMEGSFWNFEGMSGMAKTTSDSILGVIWKFELIRAVNMQIRETTANMPNVVMPPGEQHGVGEGLRSLTAFLV